MQRLCRGTLQQQGPGAWHIPLNPCPPRRFSFFSLFLSSPTPFLLFAHQASKTLHIVFVCTSFIIISKVDHFGFISSLGSLAALGAGQAAPSRHLFPSVNPSVFPPPTLHTSILPSKSGASYQLSLAWTPRKMLENQEEAMCSGST